MKDVTKDLSDRILLEEAKRVSTAVDELLMRAKAAQQRFLILNNKPSE